MKWFTPEGAAKHLHVSEKLIYETVRSGKLESHAKPSGRGVLIPESALDALVMSWPSGAKVPEQLQAVTG